MRNMRVYIDIVEFMAKSMGVLRFHFSMVFRKNKIYYVGLKQYLGKNSRLAVRQNGKIYIGKSMYLSERSLISVYLDGCIEIGTNNFFNSNVNIVCYKSIKIGNNNLFAQNVVIIDHNHKYDSLNKLICKQGYTCKPVEIGSDCWICANVVICPGAYIGDHIVVGANSVVTGRLEKPGVYVGNPAKLIKER